MAGPSARAIPIAELKAWLGLMGLEQDRSDPR